MKNIKKYRHMREVIIFIGLRSDHSLPMSATDYVSNSLSYDLAETKLKFSPNYCMDFSKLIVKVVEFIFCAKPNRVEV